MRLASYTNNDHTVVDRSAEVLHNRTAVARGVLAVSHPRYPASTVGQVPWLTIVERVSFVTHTTTFRSGWFVPEGIGCGGTGVLPSIYRQRIELGELPTQHLVFRVHKLVEGLNAPYDLSDFRDFENSIIENPESLLNDTVDE